MSKQIVVGDIVHTRRGDKMIPHSVTQLTDYYGATLVILDSGRHTFMLNARDIERIDGAWCEKEQQDRER